MSVADFQHRHAGHCESGVASILLHRAGTELSEPMALGLSASLTFAHLPFVKVGGLPLTSYRMPPGSVIKGLEKRLGVRFRRARFADPQRAMAALDAWLAEGHAVGLQTSVYWLPYFPPEMRFHFNAHNIVVYGRDGDDYLISDPVFDQPQRCAAADLRKARFAKGIFAPRGLQYVALPSPPKVSVPLAARRAIDRTWKMMLHTPVPFIGVRAIHGLARRIAVLDRWNADPRMQRLYIGNIVRMQEEIGTGGGGFRFMYAAFLQEIAEQLAQPVLAEASATMTQAGDQWRRFALAGANFMRERGATPSELAVELTRCAELEEQTYLRLKRWSKALG